MIRDLVLGMVWVALAEAGQVKITLDGDYATWYAGIVDYKHTWTNDLIWVDGHYL